jgi:hypothetical protein
MNANAKGTLRAGALGAALVAVLLLTGCAPAPTAPTVPGNTAPSDSTTPPSDSTTPPSGSTTTTTSKPTMTYVPTPVVPVVPVPVPHR